MNGPSSEALRQVDRQGIETFVRDVLGCGCPDEVFRHIELGTDGIGPEGPGFTRLVVGERLLIYLVAAVDTRDLARDVQALAAHGLAERDEKFYVRFRLVVVSRQCRADAVIATDAFSRAVGRDPRAHLHCLEASSVPPGVMPVPTVRPTAAGA